MITTFRMHKYLTEIDFELKNNILPFWMIKTVDTENGGFYGQISNELVIDKHADKGAILNSRILWTFSHAYRFLGDDKYLDTANRAYNYLIDNFWDKEYSGLYWMVDYKGEVENSRKQIYNIAFGIYGLSEFYLATGNKESLDRAIELFNVIEDKSLDDYNKGYFEAYSREWEPIDDLRLSSKDLNEKKSMNTHLHLMEAYTNLFRAWKDEDLRNRLIELINITLENIIDSKTLHFKLFFDEKWNSKVSTISYGHDIEGSWLLLEAAREVGDKELIGRVESTSAGMAQKVFEEGIDKLYGGIYNETEDTDKPWWVQAEAMVGFINAFELTKKDYFFDAAYNVWEFINKYVVDKKYGEWYWKVKKDGEICRDLFKVEPWKCPYHSARACIELISRLKDLLKNNVLEASCGQGNI